MFMLSGGIYFLLVCIVPTQIPWKCTLQADEKDFNNVYVRIQVSIITRTLWSSVYVLTKYTFAPSEHYYTTTKWSSVYILTMHTFAPKYISRDSPLEPSTSMEFLLKLIEQCRWPVDFKLSKKKKIIPMRKYTNWSYYYFSLGK